jgi:hypothetical protein
MVYEGFLMADITLEVDRHIIQIMQIAILNINKSVCPFCKSATANPKLNPVINHANIFTYFIILF